MEHSIPSTRVLHRMTYAAMRDTKNYTYYQNEERPEDKLNGLYMSKGLPAKLEVWIVIPEATEAKASA